MFWDKTCHCFIKTNLCLLLFVDYQKSGYGRDYISAGDPMKQIATYRRWKSIDAAEAEDGYGFKTLQAVSI